MLSPQFAGNYVGRWTATRSFGSQGDDRIDAGGAAGRNDGGNKARNREQQCGRREGSRICGLQAEQKCSRRGAHVPGSDAADCQPGDDEHRRVPKNHADDGQTRGPEGHAHTNLAGALGDKVSHQAVDANRGNDEPQEAEQSQQQHADFALRNSRRHHLFHRPDVSKRNVGQHGKHGALQGRQHVVWIADRPDDKVATEGLGLLEWYERLWQRIRLEAHLMNVADDADNGAVLFDTDNLTNRIGIAEVRARRGFIDDHDRRSAMQTRSWVAVAPATKKKDALTIGAPAAGGAIVGGILGGKKGAGIGALAGGGAGTAVVLSTRGKDVRIGRGTTLAVRLTSPLTVGVEQ